MTCWILRKKVSHVKVEQKRWRNLAPLGASLAISRRQSCRFDNFFDVFTACSDGGILCCLI